MLLAAGGLCLLDSGCRVTRPFERPLMKLPVGEDASRQTLPVAWWRLFHDSALDDLEERALRRNQDLLRAAAVVDEAAALSVQSASSLYPRVDLKASSAREELTRGQQYTQSLPERGRDLWQLSGVLAYEVDLWGKLRARDEAGQARLLASKAGRDALCLRLAGEVASAYIAVRTWEAKCRIIRHVHESYQQTCAMYEKRFEQGQYPELELRRVQAERAKTLAQLRTAENELSRAESALAVLVGDDPASIGQGLRLPSGPSLLDAEPPAVPSGLSADLLERRPDIGEQEQLLGAAHWDREEARAARWPSLSLTGALGQVSTALSETLKQPSRFYNMGMGAGKTLFDAGAERAAVEAASARVRERTAAYRQTVLTAFREVRDALVEREKSEQIYAAASEAAQRIRRSWEIASKQYAAGYIGLMDTLDTHRSLLSYELEVADAAQMRCNAVVQICKALGGGWKSTSLN